MEQATPHADQPSGWVEKLPAGDRDLLLTPQRPDKIPLSSICRTLLIDYEHVY